jgi:hypothetical protein
MVLIATDELLVDRSNTVMLQVGCEDVTTGGVGPEFTRKWVEERQGRSKESLFDDLQQTTGLLASLVVSCEFAVNSLRVGTENYEKSLATVELELEEHKKAMAKLTQALLVSKDECAILRKEVDDLQGGRD